MLSRHEVFQTLQEAKNYFLNEIGDNPYIVSLKALRENEFTSFTSDFKKELENVLKLYRKCEWKVPEDFINSKLTPQKKFHKILPFILSWQKPRFCDRWFKKEYKFDFSRFIDDYSDRVEKFYQAIKVKLENLSFFSLDYYYYERLFSELKEHLGKEPVSTAKILHIFSPKAFIPWDRQIANRFSIPRTSKGFAYFNFIIKAWIFKNPYVMLLEDENYSILKILDMAFFILANEKIPSCSPLAKKIIEIINEIRII
jgi:hypothetical protein